MAAINPKSLDLSSFILVEPALQKAARHFVFQWPLQSFIACNPLLTFESWHFFDALNMAQTHLGQENPLALSAFAHFLNTGDLSLESLYPQVSQYCESTGVKRWHDWLWTDITSHLTPHPKKGSSRAIHQTMGWLNDIAFAFPTPKTLAPILVSAWVDHVTGYSIEATIDAHLIKWLSAFLDKGQASWGLPERDKGLFHAWQLLVSVDTQLETPIRNCLTDFLAPCTNTSYAAINAVLNQLAIPHELMVDYFTQHFRRLPGWVGHLHWLEEHQSHKNLMADYMAIRLCYEWAYCHVVCQHELKIDATLTALQHVSPSSSSKQHTPDTRLAQLAERLVLLTEAQGYPLEELRNILANQGLSLIHALNEFDDTTKRRLFIEAMESHYQATLLTQLRGCGKQSSTQSSTDPALAQMVFCIDVRSEPLRRTLEARGHIETLGFAGFFGLPVRVQQYSASYTMDCCPVLLSPRYHIEERAHPSEMEREWIFIRNKTLFDHAQGTLLQTKKNGASAFGYIEAFGLLYASVMVARTLAPVLFNRLARWLVSHYLPSLVTQFELSPNTSQEAYAIASGIALEEQIFYAETVLTLMGLTQQFSPFVILCGHGSQTQNNHYASALDCGACGGNPGGSNARLLATILNDSNVREALSVRNITIPDTTRFIGAEHNTVTDEITLFDLTDLSQAQYQALQPILNDLTLAAQQTHMQRVSTLATHHPHEATKAAVDWSQVRPEWGLARNAAFIAAPRKLTQSLDLEGRVFLHSYDWAHDKDGIVLETIMTAPLIVAEWINTQYLLSTLDNGRFGSGTKVLHNVVGQHGVMLGNASDLQVGLPMQSVMRSEHEPYHVPLRLTTVIEAPTEHIQSILDRQAHVKDLVDNEWIFLYSRDPNTQQLKRYIKHQTWHIVDPDYERSLIS